MQVIFKINSLFLEASHRQGVVPWLLLGEDHDCKLAVLGLSYCKDALLDMALSVKVFCYNLVFLFFLMRSYVFDEVCVHEVSDKADSILLSLFFF